MRTRCSVFSATLLFALAACSAAPPPQAVPAGSGAWTQFRLNPQHNATLPGALKTRWRLETHGGFSSSPAIAGATAYIGNNKGSLFAIDARSGRPRWRYRVAAPLMSNPLVYDGLVIVGEGDSELRVGNLFHPFNVGAGENALLALDAVTGALRWRIRLAGSGMATPAIVDGRLIDQHGGGQVIALDPRSGSVVYTKDDAGVGAMSAVLPTGNGTFATAGMWMPTALLSMFTGQYHNPIQKRNARDGSLIWSTDLPKSAGGIGDCPPAGDGRFIFCDYVGSPSNAPLYEGMAAQEYAWAVDAATGRIAWRTALERGARPSKNAAAIPLAFGGRVYVGSSVAPYVHALRATDGRVLWRVRVRGPVKGGIVERGGSVYFGDLGGYLWALDAATGKVVGAKNMQTSFNVGSPAIVGETLIIGSETGAVIAVPLEDVRSARDDRCC